MRVVISTVLVSFLYLSTRAVAAQLDCQPDQWIGTRGMQNDEFRGSLAMVCKVKGADQGGVKSLEKYLIQSAGDGVAVNSGPYSAEVTTDFTESLRANGLDAQASPGTGFDVTVHTDGGTIESLVGIALESSTDHLLYQTRSKAIKLPGMAGYLRKLNVGFIVSAGSEPSTYTVTIFNTIWVRRPWYAPPPAFETIALKTARDQFNKNAAQMLPGVAAHL